MTKKRLLIIALVLVVLASTVVAVWFFVFRTGEEGETADVSPRYSDTLEEYAKTATDPTIQASTLLLLANEKMTAKDYGGAIEYAQKVLNQPASPADMKQIARRTLMYAYSYNGDSAQALAFAQEYKQNLPSDDPTLRATEESYINQQISNLEAGQPLQVVGGAEEGE